MVLKEREVFHSPLQTKFDGKFSEKPFIAPETPLLSPIQIRILHFMALGNSEKEIETRLIEEKVDQESYPQKINVHNIKARIFGRLKAKNTINAVLIAINKGILKLEEEVSDLDVSILSKFTENELSVIKEIAKNCGENSENSTIAKNLSTKKKPVSKESVKGRLSHIKRERKLSKIRATLLYLYSEELKNNPNESTKISSKKEQIFTRRRILSLIAEGATNQEIADILGIEIGQVKTRLNTIFSQLKVKSRAEAITKAHRNRIINLDHPSSQSKEDLASLKKKGVIYEAKK